MTFLLIAVVLLALPGWAQVNISAELGWGGTAVLGRVNPIWVRMRSTQAAPVSGTLVVAGEYGSPWRGQGKRELSAPILVPPGGTVTLIFPWPVERGMRTLSLKLVTGDLKLATEIPVESVTSPLSGFVGPSGRGVSLSPSDLIDPLLLHPFQEITLGRLPLSESERAVLSAWATYLGGKLPSERGIISLPWPNRDDLAAEFSRTPLPHPPLAPLALAVALYLVGIGFFLPPAARGRSLPTGLPLAIALGLSLFCPLLYKPLTGEITFLSGIIRDDVAAFRLEFLCLTGIKVGEWRGEGFWSELLPVEEGAWEGRDLAWEWGPEGVVTKTELVPGTIRVLWRLVRADLVEGGEIFVVEDGGLLRTRDGKRGSPAKLVGSEAVPLWNAISKVLSPGDRLEVKNLSSRQGGGLRKTVEVRIRHG